MFMSSLFSLYVLCIRRLYDMSIRWRTYQCVQNSFYEHQSNCAVRAFAKAFARKMMLLPYASCCIMFLLPSNHQKRRAGWMTSIELKVQLPF